MKIIKWSEWKDNLNSKLSYNEEEYACVAAAAREAGYIFPGEYHQNGEFGVPYFDNGTPFMVTQREWGMVMAMAWPELINEWCNNPDKPMRKDHSLDYVAFAWYSNELEDKYVYP